MPGRSKRTVGQTDPVVRLALARAAGASTGSVHTLTADLPLVNLGDAADVELAIRPATDLAAGSLSAADKTKLDGLFAGGALVVANAAALTAVPAALLPNGYPAEVETFGAAFALAPAGPTVDGSTVLAASDARVWLRGASLIAPAALAQTDWYWDPAAGSDEAAGTVGLPVKHFAEITRRLGNTNAPVMPYGQSITVHQLTAQPANTDPVFFEPKLSGGGQAILLSTLIVLQTAFVGGAVTAKVKGGPGTRLQVAAMPAGVAAKQLLFNQTRNSYAFIDAMAGAVATVQQPIAAAGLTTPNVPAPVEDNTWTTGDTFIVYDCPLLNLGLWSPVAIDENVGASKASIGWVQFARIADSSGTIASIYGHVNRAVANVLSCCRVDARLVISSVSGRGSQAYVIGCTMASICEAQSGGSLIFGGGIAGGYQSVGGAANLQGNVAIHGVSVIAASQVTITAAFCDNIITVQGALIILNAAGALWGSVSINNGPGGVVMNQNGPATTWVQTLLTSGTLQFGSSVGTGSAYVGAGVFTDGISLTPANIDAGGAGGPGLVDLKTGARFCNAA